MSNYLAVAVGSALGGLLRYFVAQSWLGRYAAPFPAATFFINVTGSFILGFVATLAAERLVFNPHLRLALTIGFVGAYTTFATFEYETAQLASARAGWMAVCYVAASVILGFAAVQTGSYAARLGMR